MIVQSRGRIPTQNRRVRNGGGFRRQKRRPVSLIRGHFVVANGRFNISFDSDPVPQAKAIVVLPRTVFLVRKKIGVPNRFLPILFDSEPLFQTPPVLELPERVSRIRTEFEELSRFCDVAIAPFATSSRRPHGSLDSTWPREADALSSDSPVETSFSTRRSPRTSASPWRYSVRN
jgi:hypothetical protein